MSLESLDVAIGTYRMNVINRIERDDVSGACFLLLNMNALLDKHKRLDLGKFNSGGWGRLSDTQQRGQKAWLRNSLVKFEEHYAKLLRDKSRFGELDAIIEFYRKAIISRRDHEELLDACYLQWAQVQMLPDKYRQPFKVIPLKGLMITDAYNRSLERWLANTSELFERTYQQWKLTQRNQFLH